MLEEACVPLSSSSLLTSDEDLRCEGGGEGRSMLSISTERMDWRSEAERRCVVDGLLVVAVGNVVTVSGVRFSARLRRQELKAVKR